MTKELCLKESIDALKKVAELKINEILNLTNDDSYHFYINTKSQKYIKGDLETKKQFLIVRINKDLEKDIIKKTNEINLVYSANDLVSVKIQIEWKKSKMWGSNPTCNIVVKDDKDGYFNYTSGSIGGCGYDKESTSVAEALNASPTIRKLFCEKGENVSSYGFRHQINYSLPYLEGGVGCNCYSRVFEEMGYKFESIAHGKNFDVYNISKI
jgi:hypothetical protein